MPSATRGRLGLVLVLVSVLLVAVVGALGESAAVAPLGQRTLLPPWSLESGPSSALVTGLLWAALLTGTGGLAAAVTAVLAGWRPSARGLLLGSVAPVLLLVLVAPLGSADPLSYAAYGRIALQGGDPYVVAPDAWRSDRDPVVSAVRPPWRSTPSVYGPVATGAMTAAAAAGGGSVRTVVWLLSLLAGSAFVATSVLLRRLVPHDPLPMLLWAWNPLLLWDLVAGAHIDALALLPAVAALLVARRARFEARAAVCAGALAGVAVAVKLPYAVVVLALLWALRRHRRPAALALSGAVTVLAVGYAVAGPHALSRTGPAADLVSLASVWAPLAHALDDPLGFGTSRELVRLAAVALALLLVGGLHRLVPQVRHDEQADPALVAARAWLLLAAAYVLAAPYVLPWYDAIAWAPLAVVGGTLVAGLLVAHSAALALAYVPGRVEGLSGGVERVTLDLRRDVTPWWGWVVVLAAGLLAWRAGPPAPGRARGTARSRR